MSSAIQTPVNAAEGHIDPAAAFVPVQTRSERPTSFDPEDFGIPTGREVNWKHTPQQVLEPLLRDEADELEAVTITVNAPSVVNVGRLASSELPRGEFFVPEDRVSAVTWKQDKSATHISIPNGVEIGEPVVLTVQGHGGLAHAHIVIEAEPQSRAKVVLRHHGSLAFGENVEIIVRDGAHLEVVSVQQWDDDAVHAASHQARVDRDATLRHTIVSFGGAVTRVNPSLQLSGSGSAGEMFGLSYADAGQHLESQVYLHHKGAQTRGDVLFKSALQGTAARTVWIGDVLIGAEATGTDSYEANRNLVLTEGARADSIPNLEIETGDIRGAGHASATGRFDDEQLFYLQARGISEEEARRLVVMGFLTEIVQKIGIDSLEAELMTAIEAELTREVVQ
ncbi:Fe-S cluster assembly protein SufD [Microbacterium endophyticum]|uniref:Fe-S cluster assembly protein SufD n=1 Tax=Microbacterium endophyticum TaxID=1526412 RepID=A0A7W4V588_9MICO|nr:Fe-S cluster assembly protein SufD [Microbacterium endophyticum]MBB2976759.1 Fe-S cluster assembly protein SufD [Microbacterium endophyticum]NIK36604.1 Fe-S cluster assembly protein SufD [Microbacterium endophyticum]